MLAGAGIACEDEMVRGFDGRQAFPRASRVELRMIDQLTDAVFDPVKTDERIELFERGELGRLVHWRHGLLRRRR